MCEMTIKHEINNSFKRSNLLSQSTEYMFGIESQKHLTSQIQSSLKEFTC